MTAMTHKPLPEAKQFCPSLTLRKATEEGALLVDVREPDEVAQLSIDLPGVIHLPLSQLESRFGELPRDRQLILVCAVGQRSLKATYFLMYHGYSQVANMEDGIAKWARKGFPLKGSANATAGACCTPSGSQTGAAQGAAASAGGCCTPATTAAGKGCC